MIKSMRTGEKVSAKAYAQEKLGQAVMSVLRSDWRDEEMSAREMGLVEDQLQKIGARLLTKLKFTALDVVTDGLDTLLDGDDALTPDYDEE